MGMEELKEFKIGDKVDIVHVKDTGIFHNYVGAKGVIEIIDDQARLNILVKLTISGVNICFFLSKEHLKLDTA